MKQLLLIDLDGTLADSLPLFRAIYRRVLEHFFPQALATEPFERHAGASLRNLVEDFCIRYGPLKAEEEIVEYYQTLFIEAYRHEIAPFPGALEALKRWKREGRQIAIVTNGERAGAELFFSRWELGSAVDALIALERGEPPKPAPDIYRRALKHFGMASESALAVEDSPQGAMAAREASIDLIHFGLRSPSHPPPCATDWPSLCTLVERWGEEREEGV